MDSRPRKIGSGWTSSSLQGPPVGVFFYNTNSFLVVLPNGIVRREDQSTFRVQTVIELKQTVTAAAYFDNTLFTSLLPTTRASLES